jgi:hypothetical protein
MQDALGSCQRLERKLIPRGPSSAGDRDGACSSSTSSWPADCTALCTNTTHKLADTIHSGVSALSLSNLSKEDG